MPKGTRHQHQARLRQFDDPVVFVPEGQAPRAQQMSVSVAAVVLNVGSATEATLMKGGGVRVEVFEQA